MISAFFDKYIKECGDIALAVSGGADSMALCFMLSEYLSDSSNITIHALTVDHALRKESAAEALYVAEQLKQLSNVEHHILKWNHEGQKPDARIQELARKARYDLMHGYMAKREIKYLFLGHHMDDQAETFLFRLAKGSGVDGLSCMLPMQETKEGAALCRPLLEVPKADLVDFCKERGIDFIDDPSNQSLDYARVRLRKSMDILSAEGLSPKRLSICAARHARARKALEDIAYKIYNDSIYNKDTSSIVFNSKILLDNPEEIILRVILHAMSQLKKLGISDGYGARMERVENLCADLIYSNRISQSNFRKRTLGGIIFEHNKVDNKFTMSLE